MAINVKSVLTSGLVAGFIINFSAIFMVPVVGNQMGEAHRMDLVLAVEDENPFHLSRLRTVQGLANYQQQKSRNNQPTDPLHNGLLISEWRGS